MKELIKRHIYGELRESLEDNPAVALIGFGRCRIRAGTNRCATVCVCKQNRAKRSAAVGVRSSHHQCKRFPPSV